MWRKIFIPITILILSNIQLVSAQFSFSSFNLASLSKVQLIGNATLDGNRLRLTRAVQNQIGAIWYKQKQNISTGFVVEFEFQLTEGGGFWGGGDGFAFVIQNHSVDAIGYGGGALGYGGIPKSFAVEFDTWSNSGDPNGNHISIHTAGIRENNSSPETQLAYAIPDFYLDDGDTHYVQIKYQGHQFELYLDTIPTPILTTPVSIEDSLQLQEGKAWVGFTGATGAAYQNHYIISWTFTPLNAPVGIHTRNNQSFTNAIQFYSSPNPFNLQTLLHLRIPEASHVSLKIFTITGQLVTQLEDRKLPAGDYTYIWNATTANGTVLPSGVYFAVLQTTEITKIIRLILVK